MKQLLNLKNINGTNAVVLTSKHNGNTITFPIHGFRQDNTYHFTTSYSYIWSSTLVNETPTPSSGYNIMFCETNTKLNFSGQQNGLNVRGVV